MAQGLRRGMEMSAQGERKGEQGGPERRPRWRATPPTGALAARQRRAAVARCLIHPNVQTHGGVQAGAADLHILLPVLPLLSRQWPLHGDDAAHLQLVGLGGFQQLGVGHVQQPHHHLAGQLQLLPRLGQPCTAQTGGGGMQGAEARLDGMQAATPGAAGRSRQSTQ